MKNLDALIEKLMRNRAALLMKKFDKELKETLYSDIKKFKPNETISDNANIAQRMSA